MTESGEKLPVIYLKPAEMFLADRPSIIKTVLGSCVSITMFNRRVRVGAICHGLLPHCRNKLECGGGCTEAFKYVDCSIRHMSRQFGLLGIGPREIEVKLFGGADMFANGRRLGVGAQNIRTAHRVIESERLCLHTSDIGGCRGRKLFFYTHTGEVFLKRLGMRDPEVAADLRKVEDQMQVARLFKISWAGRAIR